MALPVDVQAIKWQVELELGDTPYACSSLTPLAGGTANYIFHGYLKQALPDGLETVIIKHGEPYAALIQSLELPTCRCVNKLMCTGSPSLCLPY